jgi:hypothetical protein
MFTALLDSLILSAGLFPIEASSQCCALFDNETDEVFDASSRDLGVW